MTLTVKPLHPTFGAELSGVDIAAPLDEATRAEIIAAQNKYGVCVFRKTGLTDETHVSFSRIFGHLERAPVFPGRPPRYIQPELFDAGNISADGKIEDNELTRLNKKGNRLWHTDSSFMEIRTSLSLLLAHELPPVGGETWFADTRTAYDDLPQELKNTLEPLEAVNSYWWSRKQGGYPYTEEDVDARPSARHPLVHVHEGSGRKALYISSHARDIVGWPREEGRKLLSELIAFATQPKYVFAVNWNVGDLVIWDNLCTMHRGGDFDEINHRRDMRRTTVREGGAPAQPDDPFGEMFRAAGRTAYTASPDH